MDLSAEAVRVLGCLIEKARTVPDTYPLTLNSLVSACNQSSNRWPVTAYDAGTVQRTLDDLKVDGWIRFVHPSHGERTTKFRHVVDERLGLNDDELAVVAVLGLRGPQTVGELRTRCERLHPFASLDEVAAVLDRLAGREEPLVTALARRPGEREGRWAHLLSGSVEDGAAYESARPERAAPAFSAAAAPGAPGAVDALTARIEALEAKVARLYELLGEAPDSIG
jgi:uncharacterized protein YceH (UPF0502 family)